MRRHEDGERVWFEARVWVRDFDGRRRSVRKRAATSASARRDLQQAILDRSGSVVDAELRPSDSFARLVEAYLVQQRTKELSPSSLSVYERACSRIVLPALGSLSIREATAARLDGFLRRVAVQHGPGSAKTCRAVLSGTFGVAVRYGLLTSNPVRDVSRIPKPRGGARAVGIDDLTVLRSAIAGDERMRELDLTDLVEFLIGTGCRIGEACGLRWSRVDLGRGKVTIDATVVRVPAAGLQVQAWTKTDRARTLDLPLWVQELVLRRQVEQPSNGHGLVFPTALGNVRDPSNTNRDWRDARERLGLGAVQFHAFRKSVATFLDEAGLSARDIADQLGHAQASMTQDVYMARQTSTKRQANELERIVRGERR